MIFLCLMLTAGVSYVQYLTGPELALTLFYLFPILLAIWKGGIWGGIFISFAASVMWFAADYMLIKMFSGKMVLYFNFTFRLTGFLIITYIVSELKNALLKHKDLASTDPLTSILNKRAFYELSEIELYKAGRYNNSISILCIDIDNFKYVNDNMGHSTGDKLLKSVSDVIKSNIRKIDLVGRLGGDEFAILIGRSGAEAAYFVANKLRNLLLEEMRKKGWPVTFSMGLATFQTPPETLEELVEKGDIIMYTAKKNGKNMIKHIILK
ncbi:MAG: GGDEF domain-containing protein [Spirochaetes bacterium]|jgi:diguanylate cyclase (GGDEF)-like protein|nr:GGDEF domain-containing protein [Spirochaetota bacterium]